MTPLDFATERDDASTSWERADPTATLIEQIAWNRWLVTLPDGESVHEVRLERERGAWIGDCHVVDGDRCPGFAFHSGPCAHLCVIRKADVVAVPDTRDRPVRVLDEEDVEDARADYAVERLAADGGEVF